MDESEARMIFFRRPRLERITLEGRKAAAFRRRQARELVRYPLLAAEIAESQIGIDEAEARRNAIAERFEQFHRDFEARVWKESRRDFFASDEAIREEIRRMWAGWAGPKTCLYFRYVVDRCTGQFERRATEAKNREIAVYRQQRASRGFQPALALESCA